MDRTTGAFQFQRLLLDHFSAKTRSRGADYLKRGAVRQFEVGAGDACAIVTGTENYEVSLRWDPEGGEDSLDVFCSCPAFERHGPCKHLWAVVLKLDGLGTSPGSGLDTEVLPFDSYEDAREFEEFEEFDDLDENWTHTGQPQAGGLASPSNRNESSNRAARRHTRRPQEWERTLEQFRYGAPAWNDPWSATADRTWQIRYVLGRPNAAAQGRLHLSVKFQRRLKNGKWGKDSDYIHGSHGQPELDLSEDQEIHASLRGAAYGGYGYGYTMGNGGYSIGTELSAHLLPMIARTGRLFVKGDQQVEIGPLLLDEEEPWQFRLSMESDAEKAEVRVRGEFVRGEQRMDVDVPNIVLDNGLLLAEGKVARFTPASAEFHINLLRRTELVAPVEAWGQIAEVAMACPGFTPGQQTPVLENSEPLFHLFVEAATGSHHHSRELVCHVQAKYGGCHTGLFQSGEYLPGVEPGEMIRRDLEAEAQALNAFLAKGGKRSEQRWEGPDECRVATSYLPGLVSGLLSLGWTVEAEGKLWRRAGSSSFSVRSGIDWFDLEGGIDFGDGQVASLPALVEAANAKAPTVQLGDGSLGVLPERWIESWGLLDLAGSPAGDALRFAKNQGWLLDALLAEREEVTFDKGFRELKKRIAGFKGLVAKTEPKSFHGELRAYQRTGLGWFHFLRSLGLNGCLADDMGLGKTIQVLALLENRRLGRRRKGGVDLPSLVVAPRSVVFNWVDEARKFTPRLRVLEYTGAGRQERLALADDEQVDLLVTTYGTLRLDILELRERGFDYVILDEAQAIKNPRSQAAKAARLLQSEHRLALSGTPIENHLGELWSLFEFLNPGMLGASGVFQQFARNTGAPEADEDFSRLAKALSPFFLRRTKEEVLPDLPSKTEQVLICELKGKERSEYNKLRDFYRSSLASREEEVGLPKMKIQVLEALLRLRQAACHPGLIAKDRQLEDSAKLRVLLPMLEEICQEGHKALVFSQFTSLLGIVRKHLDERGLTYEYLDGRTRKRKEKVTRFQTDEDCPLFLISIKAGGSGLNLTSADYVFLLDPWWNPAVEAQAIDRVHRIGRTKPVIAYRLIASDTVEQKVVELQEGKRRLAEAVLGNGSVSLRDMTREDLAMLLS